jgi:hypothetical protein
MDMVKGAYMLRVSMHNINKGVHILGSKYANHQQGVQHTLGISMHRVEDQKSHMIQGTKYIMEQ